MGRLEDLWSYDNMTEAELTCFMMIDDNCQVPLCEYERQNRKWPFCPQCMGNTLRQFVKLAKMSPQHQHTSDTELALDRLDFIVKNWEKLVEAEQRSLDEHGYNPDNYK